MPDQGSASDEHALIQETSAPLAEPPDHPTPDVAHVEFPIVLRGYDRLAVDAYVQRISQLVAELQAGRSPQDAVRRALERVGEQVSGILQRAHETAEEITARSRAEAEDRLEAARSEAEAILADARQQADATVAGAQRHLTELDAETDRIWDERHQIVEDARRLATQLLAVAEAAVERFPAADERPRTDEYAVAYTEGVGAEEDDTGEVTEPAGDTGEMAGPPAGEDAGQLTEPFDVEAQAPLPGEEPTQVYRAESVDPSDDDTDELLAHDAQ